MWVVGGKGDASFYYVFGEEDLAEEWYQHYAERGYTKLFKSSIEKWRGIPEDIITRASIAANKTQEEQAKIAQENLARIKRERRERKLAGKA
jgi:hypothetical protein